MLCLWACVDSVMLMDPLTLVMTAAIAWLVYNYMTNTIYGINNPDTSTSSDDADSDADTDAKESNKTVVALSCKVPTDATETVELKVAPFSNVLYADSAAMDKKTQINLLMHVYDQHTNAGVACADENGVVVLRLRKAYTVMFVEIDKQGKCINMDKAVIGKGAVTNQ